jgi:aspartyl-tRNA(Asn)/glutamyl-tRNA(Gln) amidotransferase subunit C
MSPKKITPEQVASIAALARLDLDLQTLETFAGQLDDVLVYMDKLGELDTAGIPPLYQPVEHTSRLREDTVAKEFTREQILDQAPETDGTYFIVPKIV